MAVRILCNRPCHLDTIQLLFFLLYLSFLSSILPTCTEKCITDILVSFKYGVLIRLWRNLDITQIGGFSRQMEKIFALIISPKSSLNMYDIQNIYFNLDMLSSCLSPGFEPEIDMWSDFATEL